MAPRSRRQLLLLPVCTLLSACFLFVLHRHFPVIMVPLWKEKGGGGIKESVAPFSHVVPPCMGPERELLPAQERVAGEQQKQHEEKGGALACIPLIATNIEYDFVNETTGMGFLSRLVDSWADYSAVANKLIVTGGCSPNVMRQVDELRTRHHDLNVLKVREQIGCAGGWNLILDFMSSHGLPWGLILNSDIFIPPGSLAKLAPEIWQYLVTAPRACHAFFNVTGGPNYSAFLQTSRATLILGRFDETFFPAYFEDRDMEIRENMAIGEGTCLPPHRFNSAVLEHGLHSSYLSGTTITRERMRQRNETRREAELLAMRLERGFRTSKAYMLQKWNYNDSDESSTILFPRPFNKVDAWLGYWELDMERRRCVVEAPPSVEVC